MARIGESRREAMVPRALRAAFALAFLFLTGAGTVAHLLGVPFAEPAQWIAVASGALLGIALEVRR